MASQKMEIQLNFVANTSAAKANIENLQQSLAKLSAGQLNKGLFGNATTEQIQQASMAAQELKIHLQNATDVNTGKLNLTAFQTSLKTAGTSAKELSSALLQGGAMGTQAFAQLATAIAQADSNVLALTKSTAKSNMLFKSLTTAMTNQLTSKMFTEIVGSLNSAVSYAERLDSSLNSIRIVTHNSVEEMEKFATHATAAAQALSSTTTAYTDAALIYYQQGLRTDKDIQGRTDVTIKMANVTGDSAAKVSEQLTAIWNNFSDYGDDFERYADIITALGAATASSTDEISEGLGKFASIAQTVGLSYDYATSALATLVSATRQTPDTVGTALKTIFARLQGFNLGETLEDGVDLNKYSSALAKVGVQAIDANGNLRDMDTILNDLASRWETLTAAQKMALAQTVAGVRQYTVLISLMDNWDSMKSNLNVAANAKGELQAQQDIYDQSWAAAKKRLKSTTEEVYNNLIDEQFMIKLTDLETSFTKSFGALLSGLGGVKAILPAIGSLLMGTFGDNFSRMLEHSIEKVKMLNNTYAESIRNKNLTAIQGTMEQSVDLEFGKSSSLDVMKSAYKDLIALQTEYTSVSSKLNPIQKAQCDLLLEQQQRLTELIDQKAKEVDQNKADAENAQAKFMGKMELGSRNLGDSQAEQLRNLLSTNEISDYAEHQAKIDLLTEQMRNNVSVQNSFPEINNQITQLSTMAEQIGKLSELTRNFNGELNSLGNNASFDQVKNSVQGFIDKIEESGIDIEKNIGGVAKQEFEKLKKAMNGTDTNALIASFKKFYSYVANGNDQVVSQMARIKSSIIKTAKDNNWDDTQLKLLSSVLDQVSDASFRAGVNTEKLTDNQRRLQLSTEAARQAMQQLNDISATKGLVSLGAAISSASMAARGFKSLWDSLNNPDLSGFEKITTAGMAVSTILSQSKMALSSVKPAILGISKAFLGAENATNLYAIAAQLATGATYEEATAGKAATGSKIQQIIYEKMLNLAKQTGISLNFLLISTTIIYIGLIVGLGIALVALIKYFSNLKTAEELANEELQESKKLLNELTEHYKDATNAAKEFKEAISNYDEAKEALKGLIQGTKEYKEAVNNNNDQIIELLKKYPELASSVKSVNGVLTITEEVLDSLSEKLDNIAQVARVQTFVQQRDVAENQLEVDKYSYKKQLNQDNSNSDKDRYFVMLGEQEHWFDTRQAAEDFRAEKINVDHEAISDVYQSVFDEITDSMMAELEEAIYAGEVFLGNGGKVQFTGEYEYLQDTFSDFSNGLAEVVRAMQTHVDEINQINSNIIDQANDKNSLYANSDNRELLNKQASATEESWRVARAQQIREEYGINKSQDQLTDTDYKNIANKYAEELGYEAEYNKDTKKYDFYKIENGLRSTEASFSQSGEGIATAYINAHSAELTNEWIESAEKAINSKIDELTADDGFNNVDKEIATEIARASLTWNNNTGEWDHNFSEGAQSYFANQVNNSTSIGELETSARKARDFVANNNLGVTKLDLGEDYSNTLLSLAGNYENTSVETNAYQSALQNLTTLDENATEAEKELAQAKLQNAESSLLLATRSGELAEEYDLDAEAIEQYAKELQSANKSTNITAQEFAEMAKDQLRFDKAVTKTTENIEDWRKELALANKTGHLSVETTTELQDAYGDLLDIDGSTLSASFIKNVDNLQDLEKAISGDEEAYNRLQKVAAKDLLVSLGLDDTQFQNDINEINQLLTNNGYGNFADLEIGASIDNAAVLAGLSEIVNQAGMTVGQAQSYLSELGFDANVITKPDTVEETVAYDVTPTISTQSINYGPAALLGGFGEATYPVVSYDVNPVKVTKQVAGTALEVTSASKTSGGAVKFSGSNAGNGGGGRKSGGGGGGSKKTKEKKPVDNKDRYHTVDQQLEDLSNQLDELGDAEDRAFGAEKIKTMAREMAKLNEQVAKYNDKLVEAKNYLTQDRAKAEDFASKIGMSIQYGSNGEILNWDELKKGYLDWYNAGVDKYNAGGIDDDAFSKQYDDVYSDAMDAFDQLEETNNLVQELQQNILDTQRKYEDMYLAIQKEKLEINITIDENGMKLLEYFFDKLNDDLYDSVERMSILEDQIGNLIDQASAYEQNINGLLGTAGQWDGLNFNSYGLTLEDLPELLSKSNKELYEIFGGAGSNVQEIIDQLQNDYEKLLDTNKQITETRQKLVEEIGNSFSSWNEEIDKAENKLEQNAQLMEHYRNIIDIVGRKTLGITSKFIKDYNIKQLDNDLAQLSASYAQLNEQREAVSALEQAIMRETSEETKALMQKELDSMRDTLNEQVEDTAQKWEDCMRGIQEAYEDTVSVALDDWQTKMAGLAGSADMLQLSFDMATDIDDNYLDDYDKIYELSKLSADINNSIDDTDNIQSKEDLIALMEKVNELNESDADISQYTVDVLRARYELLKAEDALKEAQNAKSTVRLTQDNEGNWGYVYTADQDAVSQAEQEYADKLHALEEINQNYIDDLDQKLADLTKNASEKINQIAQDSTLTLEEKKEKIQEVYEYTNEMERYLMEQTQLALEDAMEIYEVDAQKYSELTGNKMLDDEKWVNSFEEMKIAQITGFTELQDWDQQFSDSWDDTVRNLITTTDEFVEKNAEAFDTVKMDIKNASEEMGDDLNQIADDTNKVRDSIINMGADAEQTIVSVIDYAKTWSDEWSTAIDAIISKNELLAKSCDTIISKLADAQAANDALNKLEEEKAGQDNGSSSDGGSSSSGGSSGSSSGSSGGGKGSKGVWVGGVFIEGATSWQVNQSVNSNNKGNLSNALGNLKGQDSVSLSDFQKELNKTKKADVGQIAANATRTKSTYYNPDLAQELLKSWFDTGGYTGTFQYADTGMYTGQWANGSVRANGRLAFLHQKELVLNAHDTENFLQAVDIVRNLNESLDLGALSMSKGLGNITARGLDQNTTQTIDQNVSIKAEFPNVQDRNEIEEAFNNLINKASQYANRKNK